MDVPEIDISEAARRLSDGDAVFVDVRDGGSYRAGHVPGALHLTDANVQQFVAEADPDRTVIVYCYHGHASLGGAAYLKEQGLHDVFSLRGGFEAWRGRQPSERG